MARSRCLDKSQPLDACLYVYSVNILIYISVTKTLMSGCIPTAGLTRWLDSAIRSEIELVSFNVQRLLHTWTDLCTLNLPQPKYFEGDCDETDYVALDNEFYPGTMLRSTNKDNYEQFLQSQQEYWSRKAVQKASHAPSTKDGPQGVAPSLK
jgi:hypothetical protein